MDAYSTSFLRQSMMMMEEEEDDDLFFLFDDDEAEFATYIHLVESESSSRRRRSDAPPKVNCLLTNLRNEGEEADASVQPTAEGETARVEAPSVQSASVPRSDDVASRNGDEKGPNRQRKSGNIEGPMERYLDTRTKQAEDDAAQLEISLGSDFSIKKCISVLNTLEVTKVEKAKAYGVFKNPDNREIFLSACDEDQESALIWLRNEMD